MLWRIFRPIDIHHTGIGAGLLATGLLTSGLVAAGLFVLALMLWNPLFDTRSHPMINVTWLSAPPPQPAPSVFSSWLRPEKCQPAWETDEELFSGRTGLHHFMVELGSIDDVGQAYDIAQLQENRVAYTLGRHSNDYVISFYAHTPSGFFVEYGFGGRVIDPAAWQPHETFDGPSFWGHERLYLEPELRRRMRDLRMDAAARGLRAPVGPGNCAWVEGGLARE